ncbi:ribosome maturation factor RimM [Blochmannia endosymbiont of Colobopsis nipponica]|uniref:ribosome maturation factor RimM n=1 Tax=Blochmannia endosymbiont of Colobopsis nipponica TaxID=2681987 RepID=UPI001781F347|nr:ribosome maturation factor RimM [Blochmannia endosymbiont of Colobopsis nipponica]QOI11236.1 ribosome maturation factor RimM [Blochmannia endosymbiont of Colobopsis nipponica]
MQINDNFFIDSPKHPIVLGKISKVYGVKGWLKVISFTEKICNIFNYQPWFIYLFHSWRSFYLENWRYHDKNLIVKIKSIKDRDAATVLINRKINIDISQLPVLKNEAYYWKDLIGCKVLSINGGLIGKVINLIETGANDVLIVKYMMKDLFNVKECLIPFIEDEVIKKVDIINRFISVDWDYAC